MACPTQMTQWLIFAKSNFLSFAATERLFSAVFDFATHYHDHVNEIVELTTTLANFETPSNNKEHVDKLGTFILHELMTLGADVERIPRNAVGDLLLAKWN